MIATTVPETIQSILKDQPKFLNKFFQVSIATSPGQELNDLSAEGVPIYKVPMKRGISPASDVVSIIRMVRLILKIKPDIVHSYTPKAGWVCMLSAWICRVPCRIHTFTGLIWPTSGGLRRQLLIIVDRLLCFCATHIVPEGDGVKCDLKKGFITSKTLEVIGYGNIAGVDVDYYSPNAIDVKLTSENIKIKHNISNDNFTFLYVGRLNPDKGLKELMTAFEGMPAHCQLLIVGGVDKSAPLSSILLDKFEAHPRVHCLGYQSDVRPAMLAADVLVLPSYREGFPNVLIQAGAMEVPVIATDINGCNEVVQPGLNGWLVPVKDSNELMLAMEDACFCSKKMLAEMGHSARMIITKRFERKNYWKNLLAFYRNLNI